MHHAARIASGWMLLACLGSADSGPVWPQFRGPAGSGVADHDDFPVECGPSTNLVWKVPLPAGNSSPCVWHDRVFLTGQVELDLETLCLNAHTGAVLWRRSVTVDRLERGSGLGNPASPTPATDGERVYSYFGPFGLVCYDFAGREIWRKRLPLPVTQHGVGSSPVLTGDRLIVQRDQDVGSHLLAVDQQDGRTVWQTERPGFRRGFSTPLVWGSGSESLVLAAGTLRLVAYRATDGVEVWNASGLPNEMCASPVAGHGLAFVAGWTHGSGVPRMPGFDSLLQQGDEDRDGQLTQAEAPPGPAKQHFLYLDADKDGRLTRGEYDTLAEIFHRAQNAAFAVRPGGQGDITTTHVVWKQTRGLPYVPSPLVYRDRLYLVKNGGLASCFNATNGTPAYLEERVGALGDYYASPVAANGKLCLASQPGTLVILAAGDTLNVLARSSLGEPILATPAIAHGRLYVRSRAHLWAFGADEI